MSEEGGKYTYSSLVMGLHLLLLFLGVAVVDARGGVPSFNYALVVATFFVGFLAVAGLGFLNRSPLGGSVVGASLSGSYWAGFLIGIIVRLNPYSTADALATYGPYALWAAAAFSALGLFFGLLGYLTGHIFAEDQNVEAYVFRDYWSNVLSLGKSSRREYRDLDRRMTGAHLATGDWWRQRIRRLVQARPELIYVKQQTPVRKEDDLGDVYDIASGQRIYDRVADPKDLLSLYRPSILSMPKTGSGISGGRRLAIEEFVSRFLGWFIQSKALWATYIVASAILTAALVVHFEALAASMGVGLLITDLEAIIAIGIFPSAVTVAFVAMFRERSLRLFDKRPDERVMVFAVYAILLMLYGLYYQFVTSIDRVILNTTNLFEVGTGPWAVSIIWLLIFTAALGVAYIFIHRECEASNVYLYDNREMTSLDDDTAPFREERDRPPWLSDGATDLYWVLRFMYFWRYELTTVPHPDWERVEVWADARTGEAKWIVSDYHYRELWYKVQGDLRERGLHVGFLANFHTPIPFVKDSEIAAFTSVLERSKTTLLNLLLTGKASVKWVVDDGNRGQHPSEWIEGFGLKGLAAKFCSDLGWSYWRYPWGIDNETYARDPATAPDEQPKPA